MLYMIFQCGWESVLIQRILFGFRSLTGKEVTEERMKGEKTQKENLFKVFYGLCKTGTLPLELKIGRINLTTNQVVQ